MRLGGHGITSFSRGMSCGTRGRIAREWRELRSRRAGARGGAGEEQVALAGVLRQPGGALEFGAGFVEAAEFAEQVGADAGKQMVILQRGLVGDGVDDGESSGGAFGHADRDGAIEFDDGDGATCASAA